MRADICPACSSSGICWEDSPVAIEDNDTIIGTVECMECGSKYTETYQLIKQEVIDEGQGD